MRIQLVFPALILIAPLFVSASPLVDNSASNQLFELKSFNSMTPEVEEPLLLRNFVDALKFLLSETRYKLIPSEEEGQLVSIRQEVRDVSATLQLADPQSF